MKIQKTIGVLIAVTTLAMAAQGQDLFSVKFKATCKPSDNGNGNGNSTTKMTEKDLIAQCVGTGLSTKDLDKNFELVYNPVSDSIQVVNQQTGILLCDVFQFAGGTNVVSGGVLERFVFVFSPNDATAIGSAVITEKSQNGNNNNNNNNSNTNSNNNGNTKAKIQGKIQFTMSETSSNDLSLTTGEITGENLTNSDGSLSNGIDLSGGVDLSMLTNSDGSINTGGSISGGTFVTNEDGTVTFENSTDNSLAGNGNVSGFVQAAAITGVAGPNSNVKVCSGTFNVGKLFVPEGLAAASKNNKNKNKNKNNNNNNNNNVTTGETSGIDNSGTNIDTSGGTNITGSSGSVIVVTTNGSLVVTTNNGTVTIVP